MPKSQIKEPIRLREKKMKTGDTSLYLDIYWHGERSYEFLKLYIKAKPKTATEKAQNKQTWELAQAIKSQRIIDLQHSAHGYTPKAKGQVKLLVYFERLAKKKTDSEGNRGNWLSMNKHLSGFAGEASVFSDVNSKFVEGFKEYLITSHIGRGGRKLSKNSAYSYFNKFRAGLKQAVKDNVISKNPSEGVTGIKQPETSREYLTFEELQRAALAPCDLPIMKTAFIFSCLTGLRFGDITKLTWADVREDKGSYLVKFQQQKTKGQEWQPISQQARQLLGPQRKPEDKVFTGLKYSAWNNSVLQKWILKSGINKDITFHCGRHTYATLQLSLGSDIYTVSKLLGHRELRTTQIYAKVIDEKKRAAADRIPEIKFNE